MGSSGLAQLERPSTLSDGTTGGFTDEQALEHIDGLYRTALRLTRNPADAEDLVQETYLRAFRFRDRFIPDSNLRAWLFKILSNTAISRFRHLSHEQGDTSLDDMGEFELYGQAAGSHGSLGESAEAQALNQILDIDVRRALEELPEPFRLAVLLSDVEGFSYKEIADVLDVPLGTVMSRLFRGRRMLRTKLEEYARLAPRSAEGASS
jgi:RNA polymerase sigma-70 factor (ECF subfamily)